jgi:uncharacterized protein YndB with AHSA1/START domain
MPAKEKARPISDEAVKAKTGKVWAAWFRILDRAGAKRMTHTQIAAHLGEVEGVPGWWSQMVAVRYEQERGLRESLQTCRGDFAASGSRTLDAPVAAVFRALHDPAERRRWCPDAPLEVTKATAPKSVRARWTGTDQRVAFYLFPQGSGKARVSVDHMGLASAREARRLKAWWSERLDRLRERMEG